ncbi:hypothetical protein BGZ46_002974, partial [Entomortierella lignicola]
MFKPDTFIVFHSLDPDATILWVSPSVTDILGYEPEELAGTAAYDKIVAQDIPMSRVGHKEGLMNDLVASQIIIRYIAKDGTAVPCIC